MDIQGLVRNGINTEIRELNENIQVQNFKLKYDGYGDRKEAESAIHQFKFTKCAVKPLLSGMGI